MNETWESRQVDKQIDKAWLALRLDLAERFAEGLASARMEPLDITTATGRTLTVTVDDEHVVVVAGDRVHTSANVDEAAHTVYRVLHDEWQVPHPVFLDTELVAVPSIADEPGGVAAAVPGIATAESSEQLRVWVAAAFEEMNGAPVKVAPNGDVRWSTRRGEGVVVSVRNRYRIEIWTVLGREVGFKKARKAIDRLSQVYGLKFHLRRDELLMSCFIPAEPFVAEQLVEALRAFIRTSDQLDGVATEVLRKRVKVERADLATAQQALAEAEAALAEERARAERSAEAHKRERLFLMRRLARTQTERDQARAEGETARAELARVLGVVQKIVDRAGPTTNDRGAA